MGQANGQTQGSGPEQQGKMHAMTIEEVVKDVFVITCTLLILSALVITLVDSRVHIHS